MKKLLISTMLVAIGCVSIAAQNTIINNPDNKVYFGLRVGGDITCPGKVHVDNVGVSMFKNGGGVEFGGILNVPVAANFYIEPGVKLFYDTYSMKKNLVKYMQTLIAFDSYSINKFGMRIPVMAGYHFDFTKDLKLSIFTGPELEIGFKGEECIKSQGISASESVYGDNGGMNRVNVLWCVGAGVTYQHFYVGVNGGIGMVNMVSDSYSSFHENRVTVSIGYNF